jgi:hypothetical protein
MTANKFLKMLGMDNAELKNSIESMSGKEAKEALYQIISYMNENRRESVENMLKTQ